MSQLEELISKAGEYENYNTKQKHTWCSGCGNYGILSAITRALTLKGIKPHQALLCFDVGCNGNLSDKIGANTIHGLHGRVLPLATGAALASQELQILAMAGDGATFSEGINHLVHAIRNDFPITFILHNNFNYGLTIGQASSTTPMDMQMAASPDGPLVKPLDTLQFVMGLNPSFVARGFAADVENTANLIQKGMEHKGFSYIEVMQACPTFNRKMTQDWYWDKLQDVGTGSSYNHQDIMAVRNKLYEIENQGKLATGLIYQRESQGYLSHMHSRQDTQTDLVQEVKPYSIQNLLTEFS